MGERGIEKEFSLVCKHIIKLVSKYYDTAGKKKLPGKEISFFTIALDTVVKFVYNRRMKTAVTNEACAMTLADYRKKAGLTARQAAEALGLKHPRITQIEATGTDNINRLEQLADLYHVKVSEIREASERSKLGK